MVVWLGQPFPWLALAVCFFYASGCLGKPCDCNNIVNVKKEVCGSDGITYINKCVAKCQGVKSIPGSCLKERDGSRSAAVLPNNFIDAKHADTNARLTMADLTRFKSENYKLVGKFKMARVSKLQEPQVAPRSSSSKTRSPPPSTVLDVRVHRSGNVYVKKIKPAEVAQLARGGPSAIQPFNPAQSNTAQQYATRSHSTTPTDLAATNPSLIGDWANFTHGNVAEDDLIVTDIGIAEALSPSENALKFLLQSSSTVTSITNDGNNEEISSKGHIVMSSVSIMPLITEAYANLTFGNASLVTIPEIVAVINEDFHERPFHALMLQRHDEEQYKVNLTQFVITGMHYLEGGEVLVLQVAKVAVRALDFSITSNGDALEAVDDALGDASATLLISLPYNTFYDEEEKEEEEEGGESSSLPGFAPRSVAGRKLRVVGWDDRVEDRSHSYPMRTVGMITSGCSGALIGPKSVLTAGHCVYSTATRQFFSNINFRPNSHGGGSHCERWTWWGCAEWWSERTVSWQWVSTMWNNANPPVRCSDGTLRCQTRDDYRFDFAVINLQENIGNQFGWLGFGYQCSTVRYGVTTAGYPADLDSTMSRRFRHSGTLNSFYGCASWSDTGNSWISSDLDTAGGQSGSSIWDSSNYVRAIHVSEGPGHRSMTKWVYGEVLKWRNS